MNFKARVIRKLRALRRRALIRTTQAEMDYLHKLLLAGTIQSIATPIDDDAGVELWVELCLPAQRIDIDFCIKNTANPCGEAALPWEPAQS